MRRILKTPRKQEFFDLCFFKTWKVFAMLLQVVADRSDFTSDYSPQLSIAVGLYASMKKKACFCHTWLVLVNSHFTHAILLNLQHINCQMC